MNSSIYENFMWIVETIINNKKKTNKQELIEKKFKELNFLCKEIDHIFLVKIFNLRFFSKIKKYMKTIKIIWTF